MARKTKAGNQGRNQGASTSAPESVERPVSDEIRRAGERIGYEPKGPEIEGEPARREVTPLARDGGPLPPLWSVRHDGSRYPNDAAESALLGMVSESVTREYERTLGDLVVGVLAPWLCVDIDEAPQEWEAIEHAFIVNTARELRAVIVATAAGESLGQNQEPLHAQFDSNDAALMLSAIPQSQGSCRLS